TSAIFPRHLASRSNSTVCYARLVTIFEHVPLVPPTLFAFTFDGTQDSIDAFNARLGEGSNVVADYVSPTAWRVTGNVELDWTVCTLDPVVVVSVPPAGWASQETFPDVAAAAAVYEIS